MSNNTKISWSDAKWNPIIGCSKVSEGCRNCYAARMASRPPSKGQIWPDIAKNGDWTGQIKFNNRALQQPYKWKTPRKIFVCSMGDLFHEAVPDEWIAQVFKTIYECDWHTFLILTKRPERMMKVVRAHYEELGSYSDPPPKHVWLGVSVENQQAADERIPLLLETPAAVRFISCEPLLGPVDLLGKEGTDSDFLMGYHDDDVSGGGRVRLPYHTPYEYQERKIDWIITGGETGPGARPMHPDWVRSLRDQCQEAQLPFFFKSWGEWSSDSPEGYARRDRTAVRPDGTTYFLPEGGWCLDDYKDQDMLRIGKKKAGRELDGRTWDEFPKKVKA